MPLVYNGRTTLTPLQLEEFARVFSSFTDAPHEDVALVRDLEYMLKCLGYGYRRVSEEELESLRTVVDPTDSGRMDYASFVNVIGRFVSPPPDDEYLALGEAEAAATTEGDSGRIRSGSLLTGTGPGDFVGVVGRRRASSLAANGAAGPKRRQGTNDMVAHRTQEVLPEQTMEMWATFKLFDKDNKGYISAGDLSVASSSYCGGMLSERDCFLIVNTLRAGWVRDGLTLDDFTKAMLA